MHKNVLVNKLKKFLQTTYKFTNNNMHMFIHQGQFFNFHHNIMFGDVITKHKNISE